MNITRYFDLAKDVSKLSDYNKKNIKIGAIIVYKNKVVASGYNTSKTSPIQMKYNKYREKVDPLRDYNANDHLPSLHAEMKALIDTKDMDIDWNKASIFVYRDSNNDGTIRNCRPCCACMKALKDKGIKNIYYTNENGFNYERI